MGVGCTITQLQQLTLIYTGTQLKIGIICCRRVHGMGGGVSINFLVTSYSSNKPMEKLTRNQTFWSQIYLEIYFSFKIIEIASSKEGGVFSFKPQILEFFKQIFLQIIYLNNNGVECDESLFHGYSSCIVTILLSVFFSSRSQSSPSMINKNSEGWP